MTKTKYTSLYSLVHMYQTHAKQYSAISYLYMYTCTHVLTFIQHTYTCTVEPLHIKDTFGIFEVFLYTEIKLYRIMHEQETFIQGSCRGILN